MSYQYSKTTTWVDSAGNVITSEQALDQDLQVEPVVTAPVLLPEPVVKVEPST